MSDVLEALGLGAGAGVASAGVGYLAARAMASQQQKYYQKNLAKQFAYSQLAQKLAPSNIKQGLVMAGMSPALAAEGRFSPAQSPSAPLGGNSVNMPDISVPSALQALSGVKQTASNIYLQNAEADKLTAEADSIKIDNANKRSRNDFAFENIPQYFESKIAEREQQLEKFYSENGIEFNDEKIANDPLISMFKSLADKKWDYGHVQGFRDLIQISSENAHLGADVVECALRAIVADHRIKDPEVLKSLVKNPKANMDEVYSEVAKNYASAFNFTSSGNLTYHHDLTSMLEKGDNLGTGVYIGEELADVLESWGPAMLLRRFMPSKVKEIKTIKGLTGNDVLFK